MTNPAPLSPAAQAVMDAYHAAPIVGVWPRDADALGVAAALRAAANHVPDHQMSAHMLYAIADELEGTSNTSEND